MSKDKAISKESGGTNWFEYHANQLFEKYGVDISDLPEGSGNKVYVYVHDSYVLIGSRLYSLTIDSTFPDRAAIEEVKAAERVLVDMFNKGLLKGFLFYVQKGVFARKFQTKEAAEDAALLFSDAFKHKNWRVEFERLNISLPFWVDTDGDVERMIKILYGYYDVFKDEEEFESLKTKLEKLRAELDSLGLYLFSTLDRIKKVKTKE